MSAQWGTDPARDKHSPFGGGGVCDAVVENLVEGGTSLSETGRLPLS